MAPRVPGPCKSPLLSYPILSSSLVRTLHNTFFFFFSIRMQNIIARFNTKLRRLSTQDKLISSNSVSRYVQAVLAPEMAVMLVKEDMGVDDTTARTLLRDSAALGNLLNEEEDADIRSAGAELRIDVDVVDDDFDDDRDELQML